MANKKNGKWVVAGVLGSVLLLSGLAYTVQQIINANRGKPPSQQPEAPAVVEEQG